MRLPGLSVELRSADAAEHLNKAVGTYITISPGTVLDGQAKIETAGEYLAAVLDRVLRPYYGGETLRLRTGQPEYPG